MSTNQSPAKVLLIDDDSVLLRSLKRELQDFGLVVATSSCVAEARIFLERIAFDALVCDHQMPGISGLEFLEEVHRHYPKLETFVLSGQVAGLPVAESWAEEIGVTRVFAKPCNAEEIVEAIETALEEAEESIAETVE